MSDPQPASSGFVFGPFRLDSGSYQLLRDGAEVDLTSKVFDTLVLLLRQRHRVVTKEELLAAVWRDAVVTDDSLIQCISALRRALGDDAARPTYVATIARRGYRFIAPVTEWSMAVDAAAASVASASTPLTSSAPSTPLAAPAPLWRRLFWPVIAVVLLAVGVAVGSRFTASSGPRADRVLRFAQAAPPGTQLVSGGALAPSGAFVAFAAEDTGSGTSRLWVRALDAPQPRVIEGTEGASRPFWSPDSQFVGFFASGRLKTVRVTGGPVTDLTAVGPRPTGAAWSARGQIIFSTWLSGFSAISASGGGVTRVTETEPGEGAHAWPQFLPDGERFLFSVYGQSAGIFLGRLGTAEKTRLLDADPGAVYSPDGYLVFTRDGVLTAQRFSADSATLQGDPFSLVEGNVMIPGMTNGTNISTGAGGLLAFGGATGQSELAWFDRRGTRLGALAAPVELHNPLLLSGDTRVLANSYPPAQPGVWLLDLDRGAADRVSDLGVIGVPSPDTQQIAFTANRNPGGVGIFSAPLGRGSAGGENPITLSPERKSLNYWTGDGRFLLYQVLAADGSQDLWMVPVAGDERTPRALLATSANEIQGQVSPDGNWLAYASDESGRWQVYVQAFPGGEMRQVVSPNGGAEPQWRADGRELFYLAEDDTLMAVQIGAGRPLQVGRPVTLFRPLVVGEATTYRSHYAVSRDGQRFLADVLQDPALDPITILLNWAR